MHFKNTIIIKKTFLYELKKKLIIKFFFKFIYNELIFVAGKI